MEEIEEEVCIYNIDLYNLNKYNLVSLENANIRCHVRGSIWIGGTLTGSQYVDDGSLNGESLSNSYIYENQSTIYFKSRTTQQSQDAYYKLAAQSVIDTTNYWKNILSILPKNSEYIKYVEPDVNGYVDIRYWDYQCPGADTSISTIPILYWTDATKVDMGGLAGHLIAPFADIYITYCNHCGSIVGKTITTDGESHLNYWVPTVEPETEPITETEPIIETEKSSSIIIKKTLYCNVWHTECDVMGDEYWIKDEISNPKGIKSKEGHRKDHCGAIDSWYVYLDEYGKPYAMLEMKAGATNNQIPLPAHFYTDETYTEVRDPATIKAGERIYWTTEHKGQVWHHTGVTRLDIPTFEFIVDGESYDLKPGESLEIEVSAGDHTIIEKYNKEYIINDVSVPFSIDKDENAIVTVNIVKGTQIEINFENRPKNMPEPPKPPETEPITETETETELIIETETESESETELITETESETESEETENETELITEIETESESEETELIIETESEKIPEIIIESESESERKKETEPSTEKQTKKIIEKSTEKQTETEANGEVLGTSRDPKKIQPDEIYEPETNGKKKSKINGISRKTESVGLFENLKPISIPKTGDTAPIKILIFIFSLSAIIIICIIFYKRYNKK